MDLHVAAMSYEEIALECNEIFHDPLGKASP